MIHFHGTKTKNIHSKYLEWQYNSVIMWEDNIQIVIGTVIARDYNN